MVASIIPDIGPRPNGTIRNTTFATGVTTTYTLAASKVFIGENIDPIGQPPGTYWIGYVGTGPVIYHDGKFINKGTIWSSDAYGGSLGVYANTLNNQGLIVAEVSGPVIGLFPDYFEAAFGFLPGAGAPGVINTHVNSGTILARAIDGGGGAHAFYSDDPWTRIDNSGIIAAQATTGASDTEQHLSGFAAAVDLGNGGRLFNLAGGQILAEGAEAIGVKFGRGGRLDIYGGVIENHGLIAAQITEGSKESIGLYLAHLEVEDMAVDNFGTIRADIAIYAPSDRLKVFTSSDQNSIQTITNHAGGLIQGRIELYGGDDTLVNAGRIEGRVELGNGNDLFDSTGGEFAGIADLGAGADTFLGSTLGDRVTGGRGGDVLRGGGGRDLLLGGFEDDDIAGDGGNDGLYGEFGNDLITTRQGDVAMGGADDDTIVTTDLAFARIDGEDGNDTWRIENGPEWLDLSAVLATGRVGGFEEIDLTGTGGLVVRSPDVAGIADGSELTVKGTASNKLYLVGAWVDHGLQNIGGTNFHVFTRGPATINVAEAVQVSTSATPPAGATGLSPVWAGAAAPEPGPGAGLELEQALTEIVGYNPPDNLHIRSYETWFNTTGGNVIFSFATTGSIVRTITNDGRIVNSSAGASAWTVQNYDPKSNLVNNGTIRADAGGNGIALGLMDTAGFGIGTENHGSILANAVGGLATAFFTDRTGFGPDDPITPFSLMNDGLIRAFSLEDGAIGVRAFNGGDIINDTRIEASGATDAFGVYSDNGDLRLDNNGSITALARNFGAVSIGIYLGGNVNHIVNDGEIVADIAIFDTAAYGEPLYVDNNNLIVGDIILANRFNSTTGGIWIDLDNSGEIHGSVIGDFISYGRDVVVNSGLIAGDVILGDENDDEFENLYDGRLGTDRVTNTGLIAGDVILGAENDIYDGRGGQVLGRVEAGDDEDTLYGGDFDDWFMPGTGNDTASGGGGNDTLDYSDAPAGVTVRLTVATPQDTGGGGVDTLTGFENIVGSDFDDILDGNGGDNRFEGGDGNDTITGRGGTDTASYFSAAGPVTVRLGTTAPQNTSGAGIDRLVSIENLIGSDFDDWLIGNDADNFLEGGYGDDKINGLLGSDTASYYHAVAGVTVDLRIAGPQNTRGAGFDTLIDIENLSGSAYGDLLTGNDAANVIDGDAGNDIIEAGRGDDTVRGGDGRDTINGYTGNDTIEGGDGDDTILGSGGSDVIDGGPGNDQVNGGAWADTIEGGPGDDRLDGAGGNDEIHGGAGADQINGGLGLDSLFGDGEDDTIHGNAGADSILGGDGNDALYGDADGDTIDGGPGDDDIFGGTGKDTSSGGAGADTFHYNLADFAGLRASADRITDFSHADGDLIDLSAIDAATGVPNNQAFTFIGAQAFSGVAGELHYLYSGGATYVEGDRNGDMVADFAIRLDGQIALQASDFIL